MRETLSSTITDGYLFGSKLADNIKTAKQIEQSAEELKFQKLLTQLWKKTPRARSALRAKFQQRIQAGINSRQRRLNNLIQIRDRNPKGTPGTRPRRRISTAARENTK